MTDILTRILSASPGIRAEVWHDVAFDLVEQLATVTAERDIARADRGIAEQIADRLDAAADASLKAARADLSIARDTLSIVRDDLANAARERDAAENAIAGAMTALAAALPVKPTTLADGVDALVAWCGRLKDSVREAESRPMGRLGSVTMPAQDRAEELARLIAVEPIRTGEWKALVERVRAALAKVAAPATSPPPADVFAGVSEKDLFGAFNAGRYGCTCDAVDDKCCFRAGIEAVLASLRVRLVAPVDPESVARTMRDHAVQIGLHPCEPVDYLESLSLLVRQCLAAHGVPVTPEVGK